MQCIMTPVQEALAAAQACLHMNWQQQPWREYITFSYCKPCSQAIWPGIQGKYNSLQHIAMSVGAAWLHACVHHCEARLQDWIELGVQHNSSTAAEVFFAHGTRCGGWIAGVPLQAACRKPALASSQQARSSHLRGICQLAARLLQGTFV